MQQEENFSRRNFIQTGVKAAVIVGVPALGLLAGCKKDEGEEKDVSPPEDLMQEHGLLNRVLLIYDHFRQEIANKQPLQLDALNNAAGIIRTFVEDYHERQEEDYLFPRFQKANQLTDLVQTLLAQHAAGRNITAQILQLTQNKTLTDNEIQKLLEQLNAFNTMYRPHEAREDTVLFPAFRKIVSQHEYDALGEEFEKNEQKKFGKDGFETMVEKVASIERQLGIYDLAAFTPKIM